MKKIFRNNGLSIVFFVLFVLSIGGQVIYFLQSTFENWESEFLQMALFLILTMFLFQKGSSESKDPDKKNDVDRQPNPRRKNAPWAVKKGGLILTIYKHSLCYTFSLIFLLSFYVHWKGSWKDYNEEQVLKHLPATSALDYLSGSRFWFESFQNWQSEFLSIFAMVVFSIFLREQYSSQSKPVDAPDAETGE